MTKHFFAIALFLTSLASCDKCEECQECKECKDTVSLLVGTWQVAQVDSGYIPVYPTIFYYSIDTLNYTGSFTFNKDHSGIIGGSIVELTCGANDFLWLDVDSVDLIRFFIKEYNTKAYVKKLSQDSLVFQLKDYCRGGQFLGATTYYNLILTKQ